MCVAEYHDDERRGAKLTLRKLALSFANEKKKPFQLQEVKEGVLVVARRPRLWP